MKMVRGAPLMVGAALLAVGADAFVAPGPARLATPTWVSAKPLIDASPKARVPMRAGLQTGLRMGSKGGEVDEYAFSPKKRGWLWKYSERVMDKVLLILQALVVSIYRRVVYKVLYKLHIVEDPDELSSIRPDVLTDPRLRASWNKEGSSSGVFSKQSPQKFRIGTVQEVLPRKPFERVSITPAKPWRTEQQCGRRFYPLPSPSIWSVSWKNQ